MDGLTTSVIVNIKRLKHSFAKKYPNSSILQTLLSMPDVMSSEELIGAVIVLLNLLDMETHNKLGGEL